MDIPIALLSEFSLFCNSKEDIEKRFLQILKQFLYDYLIVENEAKLNHTIVTFYKHPEKTISQLRDCFTEPVYFAKIFFIFCMLIKDYHSESKKIFETIVNWIYFNISNQDVEFQKKILLTYNTEQKNINIYEEAIST